MRSPVDCGGAGGGGGERGRRMSEVGVWCNDKVEGPSYLELGALGPSGWAWRAKNRKNRLEE